jgi:hypothetical protein
MLLCLCALRAVHFERLLLLPEVIKRLMMMPKGAVIHRWVLLAISEIAQYSQGDSLSEGRVFVRYKLCWRKGMR